jgi:membrane-associated phospholipid phosphatase
MQFLTDFADQAVVLPVSLIVAAILALLGWRRGAFAWLVAVIGTLGAMALLKVAFFACGDVVVPDADIHSPSGHTAAAAVAYGGLTALLGFSPPASFAISVVTALVFGFTRVVLGYHTLPEAMLGGLVGIAGAAALIWIAGRPPPRMRNGLLLGALLLGILLFHGAHVHAETALGRLAVLLQVWPLSACRMA